MKDRKKRIDPIPDEFLSYEEAAEFWSTHDTMDYPDAFKTVPVQTELRRRRYEVAVDEEVMKELRKRARKYGVATASLVNDMLRRQISKAA